LCVEQLRACQHRDRDRLLQEADADTVASPSQCTTAGG
jgi:hypothetical protein